MNRSPLNRYYTSRITAFLFVLLAFTASGCTFGSGARGDIILVNATGQTLIDVNIASSGATSWGFDRLVGSEIVVPASERTFKVRSGFVDLRVTDARGDAYIVEGIRVFANEATIVRVNLSDRATDEGAIEVRNEVRWTPTDDTRFVELYIVGSTAPTWGDNLLVGKADVLFGGVAAVEALAPGTYDVLARDQYGDAYEALSVVVHTGGRVDVTFTIDDHIVTSGSIEVVNDINWGGVRATISEAYLPLSTSAEWGPDLLDGRPKVLPNGTITIPNLAPGLYDLQLIDTQGRVYVVFEAEVALGETTRVTVTESQLEVTAP